MFTGSVPRDPAIERQSSRYCSLTGASSTEIAKPGASWLGEQEACADSAAERPAARQPSSRRLGDVEDAVVAHHRPATWPEQVPAGVCSHHRLPLACSARPSAPPSMPGGGDGGYLVRPAARASPHGVAWAAAVEVPSVNAPGRGSPARRERATQRWLFGAQAGGRCRSTRRGGVVSLVFESAGRVQPWFAGGVGRWEYSWWVSSVEKGVGCARQGRLLVSSLRFRQLHALPGRYRLTPNRLRHTRNHAHRADCIPPRGQRDAGDRKPRARRGPSERFAPDPLRQRSAPRLSSHKASVCSPILGCGAAICLGDVVQERMTRPDIGDDPATSSAMK